MVKKVAKRGGKREGAGRRVGPDGRKGIISGSVPIADIVALQKLADAEGWTTSQAVTEAIKLLLKRTSRA